MALRSINPYTGELIGEFPEMNDNEIETCLSRSADAFSKWKRTTVKYRKELMMRVASQLSEGTGLLARTITNEMGKTINEAIAEINKCIWVCQHYANDAEVLLQREAVSTGGYLSFMQYEPLGSILGIMPWNYPFWQVFRFAAPNLMAGNTIVLKHASNVQLCAKAIESVFEKAGLPSGTFTNLRITSDNISDVIGNENIIAVTLTGSEQAGENVGAIAGRCLKKTVLELGGSNAFIVLDDADVKTAAETGVMARMQNAGQSCIAAKRFIIHENVYEQFVNIFCSKVKEIRTGNPLDEGTDMGPLSAEQQASKVYKQVQASVKAGAELIAGGKPEGAMYPPSVVAEVKPGMPLFDEEVFGPVAPLTIVGSTEEAVFMANKSKYGLGVSLFTNDIGKAEKLVPEFSDGAVFINEMVKSDPRLPFGGTKRSGYGRELSISGIREFVNLKTVYIQKIHDKTDNQQNTVISTGSVS
jgi:succinate-semialdehyde dehydrogenase / glutarate-semialdehyde dehydrogenase